MTAFVVAVLYQVSAPPADEYGIRKPMKENGYSDSSADIAFHLRQLELQGAALRVLLPCAAPDPLRDLDWVWSDDEATLNSLLGICGDGGPPVLFCNLMLHSAHPAVALHAARRVRLVAADPHSVDRLEDKAFVHQRLREAGVRLSPPPSFRVPVAFGDPIDGPSVGPNERLDLPGGLELPVVVKPIRGRGSAGVRRCPSPGAYHAALAAVSAAGLGDEALCEAFLPGEELTISVFAPFGPFRVLAREGHVDGVMPYSREVPVALNSRLVRAAEGEVEMAREAVEALGVRGLCRVDARRDREGRLHFVEVNLKPNLAAPGRHPGRAEHASLTFLALGSEESYRKLLLKMIEHAV